jgi:acyl carrier protein/acetyltransferase-like isoleucine patch superfamily enzyme
VSAARGIVRTALYVVDEALGRAKLRGATSIGSGVRIFGWPRVANEGDLTVGARVTIVASPAPVEILVAPGARLVIGDGALLESGASIRVRGTVSIGSGARIGAGCIVDDDGPGARQISIGDGAWMEDQTVLLQGANLAPGSVLERASRSPEATARGASPSGRAENAAELAVDVDRRVRAVLGRLVAGASSVEARTRLTSIKGWDSLAALRVLVALEKEFSVVLPHHLFTQDPSLETVTPVIVASVARQANPG